ncbi:SDR family oxidoreductase [Aureimonas ureilytica]|uniref:SDR family oxidoreductase n=1 Tax=Aureimonas ureilytica TaxID=401562 RepID=UPI00036F443F|nr:SDR family oxidoreductase [Aureimonas ureilytica]
MQDFKSSGPSRRQIVGGLTTGLVAAAVGTPAFAQESGGASGNGGTGAASGERSRLLTMQDPTKAYPQPPFERQPQDAPGLASAMNPRPDHGETSYRGSGRLAGRKALITGGDSGIGRAAAIAYAREGADVAIGYLPVEESDAQEVIQLIEAEGRKAVALPGDISNESFCREMVERAASELGGLDILVNNAGKQVFTPDLEDVSTEQFDQTFKVNVYAPFWITKAALQHLKPGASIIITASVQAYDPSAELFDYAQTKASNVAFAKSLAKQLGPKGIRVNAVAPGPYWTPLQPSGGQSQENLVSFGADAPLGRPGQPAEIAGIYVLLASQESSFATGQVYGSAGGSGQP